MNLHNAKNLFRQSVEFTAQWLNIPSIYIEKDYWVTYTLHRIFNDPIGSQTVFKGGTSLSKCFDFIARFSEDIDLVVITNEGESNNQLTKKIKTISNVVSTVLPEIEIEGLTQKRGMNRKTAHTYNKEFKGEFGQIRDVIIVEATWLGYAEPNTKMSINSFIYDMMMKNGQEEIAKKYQILPFKVNVLHPNRTFCEKIMSLVRFSYTENPVEDLKKKVRHIYDLHQLLINNQISSFFESDKFDKMILKVASDDVISFKNNNDWLKHHPNESLFFNKLDDIWSELKPVFFNEFNNLVYGKMPSEKSVIISLQKIKKRISTIDWEISL